VTELHQILAVEKGTKARVYRDVTDFHHQLQASNTKLSGITRTYQPKDEEGDRLPPESTLLQLRTTEVIERLRTSLTELFDITLTTTCPEKRSDASVHGSGGAGRRGGAVGTQSRCMHHGPVFDSQPQRSSHGHLAAALALGSAV
jgi:hypothetical protein